MKMLTDSIIEGKIITLGVQDLFGCMAVLVHQTVHKAKLVNVQIVEGQIKLEMEETEEERPPYPERLPFIEETYD